jgi:hypothetical protein
MSRSAHPGYGETRRVGAGLKPAPTCVRGYALGVADVPPLPGCAMPIAPISPPTAQGTGFEIGAVAERGACECIAELVDAKEVQHRFLLTGG